MVGPLQISGGEHHVDLPGALVPDGGIEEFLVSRLLSERFVLLFRHGEQPQVTGLLEHLLHLHLAGKGFVVAG